MSGQRRFRRNQFDADLIVPSRIVDEQSQFGFRVSDRCGSSNDIGPTTRDRRSRPQDLSGQRVDLLTTIESRQDFLRTL